MPLLLSFDTATPHLSVVVSEGAQVLAWCEDASLKLSHAERLNLFIKDAMEKAGLTLRSLDAVAAGIGPGSYTGLRIGLSAAKGLCFALDKPLIGMGTLEVLLAEFMGKDLALGPNDVLMPMVDARRMEVYTRQFDRDGKPIDTTAPLILDDAWCVSRPDVVRTFVFGDGADKAVELWERATRVTHVPGIRPAAQGLARCAGEHFAAGRFADLAYLVPEYGKPANVAQSRGALL